MQGNHIIIKLFFCVLIPVFLFHSSGSCQSRKEDYYLIRRQDSVRFHYEMTGKTESFHLRSNNLFAKYNPITLFFTGSMWYYQQYISPLLSSHCLFEISCSNFSKQCIQKYGLVKGICLSADRLMRCNHATRRETPAYKINPVTNKIADEPENYK